MQAMLDPCLFINQLDERALTVYADHLQSLLRAVQGQLNELSVRAEVRKEMKARKQKIFQARDILTTYLINGMTAHRALDATSKTTGIEITVLEAVLPVARSQSKSHKRDRKIMQMVATGWTDAAIGKRLKLHPKSINRLVSQARKVG